MNKQIEEMADIITRTDPKSWAKAIATSLYNAGYRKQSEGEWIKRNHSCYCSVCGGEHGFAFTTGSAHNYCPKCGAKMKGGEQE